MCNTESKNDSTPSKSPCRAEILRVLDAATNRANEGLRVIEDFVRFILDDQHLTVLTKQLRHDLSAALTIVSPDSRLACRDTMGDVGTGIVTQCLKSGQEVRVDGDAGIVTILSD